MSINPVNEEKSLDVKGFIIGSIVSFVVTGIIMGLIILISFTSHSELTKEVVYVGWIDALTLSSVVMLLFYLLNLLTREGALDILAYSFKLVWYNTFYRSIKETKLPKTYREYRELKHGQKKDSNLFLLLGAVPYLVAGLIIMIIYYGQIV